jgi:hypothetical protein
MKIRWINCEGIPLLTASRWVPNKAVKYSLCKRCRMSAMPMAPRRSERWLDSRCTPEWRSKPASVTSWSDCAATLPAPAIAERRLSLTHQGKVRYELKTPYRDGTTHVIFEPVDFTAPAHPCARGISASLHVIAKLAALVPRPRPRVNLTRLDAGHPCPSPYRQPSVVQIHSR